MSLRPAVKPPVPLVVAALLVGVEALVMLGYAALELAHLDLDRPAVALTTGAFFLLYGAGLLACAWGLLRLTSWARSPAVLAQLIQLGVAWSFWGGETTGVAIGIAVVALITLVGIFHPASIGALAGEEERQD